MASSAIDTVDKPEAYDYVIVGGGPVGAVMALGLASQGHSVALIERDVPPIFSKVPAKRVSETGSTAAANALGVDPRTVALSLASKSLLAEYGAWPEVAVSAFARMEVWEDRGTSVLRFGVEDAGDAGDAGDVGDVGDENIETLGHIAQIGPWREQLWQQLKSSSVVCKVGRPVLAVEPDPEGFTLTLAPLPATALAAAADMAAQANSRIFARTLIAADGANSIVRRALHVAMPLTDTGQSALAFAAHMEAPHEHTAFQRFLADGPLALLPLATKPASNDHLVSVVWSTRNAHAAELAQLTPEELAAALTIASEERLGRALQCLPAARFPLRQGVIQNFCPQSNVIFIGDAARVVHPLAGQGVNLGFEDVRALLECTASSRSSRPNPASLQRFARIRRARSRLAVAAMSALSAGYAVQSPGLLLARNLAIRALGRSSLARKQLLLEAMGLGPVARAS